MVILDQALIERANNCSQFNAGTHIANAASMRYAEFDGHFVEKNYTEEQKEYLAKRKADYKKLIEQEYTDQLQRRANWVPVTVAGPSNYNGKQMSDRADRALKGAIEGDGLMVMFLINTEKHLEGMKPLTTKLEEIRNNMMKYGEIISSDDPHAIEKLQAKLSSQVETHNNMKQANAEARKSKATTPYLQYELTNSMSRIKATEKRIQDLTQRRAEPTIKGFTFEGGEVVANNENNRLQILFDEKPSDDMRFILKSRGFRWAPSEGTWQRQLTHTALTVAKGILINT